jgi:hypothetical protein
MPVYTGTMDGETIGSYPELADNERVVNTEIFYHFSGISNPFEPNPFQYNMYRITTEYFTPEVRRDASYYHGALAGDRNDVTEAAPMGHRLSVPTSMSPSEFAKLLSPGKRSLPSSLMKGGKNKSSNKIKQYKPLRGMKCRPGYKFVSVPGSEVGMCVLIRK